MAPSNIAFLNDLLHRIGSHTRPRGGGPSGAPMAETALPA